jgi:adenylate cyclase class 2
MSNSSSGPGAIEAEVKFLVSDHEAVRRKLAAAGGVQTVPRIHERNVRFETPDGALLKRNQLLRLRQDRRVRLTFKSETREDEAHAQVKVREELEVSLDDFDTTAAILQRLGFMPVQEYEKYRETFRLGDVEVVLDELPFGDFVELEGPEEAIRPAADLLGLDWSKRLLTNYLALMMMVKQAYDLPFDDLTFDNFRGADVVLGSLLPVCDLGEVL